MAQIHRSEDEIAGDFTAALDKVRQGIEVIVEHDHLAVAILTAPAPPRRTIREILALMPKDSPGIIDADFAQDVEAAVRAHRDPLDASQWD